ncbi:MAG: Fe-S cluster assembly protein SufD [candidate division Zixibacteria bacterium HGW-Zixibacteria-1]|nr:MAG: Fe-S cluster assembly protein SufD [candidate division Zixibacteria bacterium HGW-Zixibacteria-1]
MSTQVIDISKIDFRKSNKQEPPWLYNFRKNSWNSFMNMALPERMVHLWKYTDPEYFLINDMHEAMRISPAPADNSIGLSIKPEYSGYGYNRPDHLTMAALDESTANSGVIFKDLYAASSENEDLVGNHLGHLVDGSFGKFEAMNAALWSSGLFLYVPDNTIIEKPIRLQRHPAGPMTFLRLLVIVGKNSEATIIDDYSGECRESDAVNNSVAEIFVGESSNVRYANTQRFEDNCRSYITQRARLADNARIHTVYGGLGGNISKVNAGTILAGRGADSKMSGVVFANASQHFDYHTLHHHKASESFSNIDFKVILKDKGVSAYTGLIKINQDTQNCEAYQLNRNLLLNKGTRAESIPELEILCDQVRCSHGSTTGPIDPDMVFYLKSRGLNYQEAVRTLITGFVEPTLAQVPADLASALLDLILRKLEG